MIKYSLLCEKDHDFEGWFGSSDDYDEQSKRGFVECPHCGSTKISKALMAPGISGTKKSDSVEARPMATMAPQLPVEMVTKLREIKQHIEKTSENVGDKFPEEARKIHYGEAQARGIYGKVTAKEAVDLVKEGVSVVPIPELPEDKN